MNERQMNKIHSEVSRYDVQRQQGSRINSERFYNLVGTVSRGRNIGINDACQQISISFDEIHCLNQMVINIAEVQIQRRFEIGWIFP